MGRIFSRHRLLHLGIVLLALPHYFFPTAWNGTYSGPTHTFTAGDTVTTVGLVTGATFLTNGSGSDVININVDPNATVSGTTASSYLTFRTAAAGDIINVNLVTNDLTFAGDAAGNPLLIQVDGPGTTNFNITQGQTLTLGTSTPTLNQPAHLIIRGRTVASTLQIKRIDAGTATTDNSVFDILGDSSVTFAGNQLVDGLSANLITDATTDSSTAGNGGVLLIKIEDKFPATVTNAVQGGALSVEMVALPNGQGDNVLASDVNYATLQTNIAGTLYGQGIFSHSNTTPGAYTDNYSSLVIENNNSSPIPLRFPTIPGTTGAAFGYPISGLTNSRPGFILGLASSFNVGDGSYVWYVGGTNNSTPQIIFNTQLVSQFAKYLNYSALFVEGPNLAPATGIFIQQALTSNQNASIPSINCDGTSGIYFSSRRGGLDNNGNPIPAPNSGSATTLDYLVPPYHQSSGAVGYGNIVLSTVGTIHINGEDKATNVLSIIGNQITEFGNSLLPSGTETIFPEYTHVLDLQNNYLQYGKSCFLFDGNVIFNNMTLLEVERLHNIPLSMAISEPEAVFFGGSSAFLKTYLTGGVPPTQLEAYWNRPKFMLTNSDIDVANASGMAISGIDILVTDLITYNPFITSSTTNNSQIAFFNDGTVLTKQFILGTSTNGTVSTPPAGSAKLDPSSHLDVLQAGDLIAPGTLGTEIELILTNDFNTSAFIETAPTGPLTTQDLAQRPVGTLLAAKNSNISMGLAGDDLSSLISGPNINCPCIVNVTGRNINIASQKTDLQDLTIARGLGAGVMAIGPMGEFTYAQNAYGKISIPMIKVQQTAFPTSSDPVINISPSMSLEHYTGLTINPGLSTSYVLLSDVDDVIDGAMYDTRTSTSQTVAPSTFNLSITPAFGHTTVQSTMFANAARVLGKNRRLRLSGSLPLALITVDGGRIDQIDWKTSPNIHDTNYSAIFQLTNNGQVTIGTRSNTPRYTIGTIGLEGAQFVANGTGKVNLEGDTRVIGTGQFMAFSDTTGPNTLTIYAPKPTKLIVSKGSLFDLTALKAGDTVRLTGFVELVCEPGSGIAIPAGVTLTFEDHTKFLPGVWGPLSTPTLGTPSVNTITPAAVHVFGQGSILLNGHARWFIDRGTYVSIDALGNVNKDFNFLLGGDLLVTGNTTTDMTITITDNAKLALGNTTRKTFGGALQIGNSRNVLNASVRGHIIIDGASAILSLGNQAILGLGAGVAEKPDASLDNSLVGQLFNVSKISIDHVRGRIFAHHIAPTSNETGSLIVLGNHPAGTFDLSLMNPATYSYFFGNGNITPDAFGTVIHGGSNVFRVLNSTLVNPEVEDAAGIIPAVGEAGIFVSSGNWVDPLKSLSLMNADSATAFAYLTHQDIATGMHGAASYSDYSTQASHPKMVWRSNNIISRFSTSLLTRPDLNTSGIHYGSIGMVHSVPNGFSSLYPIKS